MVAALDQGRVVYLVVCVLACTLSTSSACAQAEHVIFDFTSRKGEWRSVNDDVMGGVSRGDHRIIPEGRMEFSGYLSLENNGGFASIRSAPRPHDLASYDGISLRVRGDGRDYYVNLHTGAGVTPGSWRASFSPARGTWQEVRIPFRRFRWTVFGRPLPAAALDPGSIRSIGFTIADKKEGPFRLEIDRVGAYGGEPDLAAIVGSRDDLSTLAGLVRGSGVADMLGEPGPLTVFAPTNRAFAGVPEETLDALREPDNRARLTAVLLRHITGRRLMLGTREAETLDGGGAAVRVEGPVSIEGVTVLESDLVAANGVLHVIDAVLMPAENVPQGREAGRQAVRAAIARAVPMFNAERPGACAAIYEVTAERLLRMPAGVLPAGARSSLSSALERGLKETDPTERAWTLRAALDGVYRALTE